MRKRKLYKEYDYEEIYNKSVLGEETVEDAIQRGKKMVSKDNTVWGDARK